MMWLSLDVVRELLDFLLILNRSPKHRRFGIVNENRNVSVIYIVGRPEAVVPQEE